MNVNEQNTTRFELADSLPVSNMSSQWTKTTQGYKLNKGSIRGAFGRVGRMLATLLILGLSTFAFGQITVDFNHTGNLQVYAIPAGVNTISIEAWGAQGGGGDYLGSGPGAQGGYATGELSVTPGQVLTIYVGGQGADQNVAVVGGGGFNGGGDAYGGGGTDFTTRGAGGGASDVRIGAAGLNDRVIVAGGGGGSCGIGGPGGIGGGLSGDDGTDTGFNENGTGGSQVAGGTANAVVCTDGVFGIGGGTTNGFYCGGAGGGYYGGGGGCGAGGGSSYIGGVTNGSTTPGLRSGNGFVQITLIPDCENENYSCDDEVTITLGDAPDCEALVEPADVLNNLNPVDASCFEVTLTDGDGNPLEDENGNPLNPANLVTADYIGEEVLAMVMNTATNTMKCMGIIINVVDGSDPIIFCPDDTEVVCGESTHPDDTGEATADDCSDITITYEDSEVMENCDSELIKTITRTWTVVDAVGKTASCDQIIEVERLYADDFTLPDNAEVECNAGMPNIEPTDDGAGYPTGPDGQNVFDIAADCGIWVSYTDDDLIPESCAGFNIIKRTWMVMDTCGTDMTMGIQLITVVDNVDPIVTCPPNDTISVVQDSCYAHTLLHDIEVIEECSGYTVEFETDNGEIVGNELINLPLGTTTVTVTVTDGCGNSAEREYFIEVEDQVAPVPICETVHTVSLSGEPTNVPAFVFDDGSYDNCSDVTFLVRRMEADSCDFEDATDFGNYVPFYCCDVGDTIMIELKVTDAAGNMNFCMVDVYVDDKLDPEITCPADIEINCNESTDPSNTGEPIVSDNCEIDSVSYVDNGAVGCNGGTIIRTWTVVDIHGNSASCDQTIVALPGDPFIINDTDCTDADPNDGVIWPCAVYGLTTCLAPGSVPTPDELISDYGFTEAEVKPQILANTCIEDFIVVGYEDSDPIIGTNICVKFLRTWTVLNCCDPNHIVVGTYNQLIEFSSTDAPTVTCEDIATVIFPAESQIELSPEDDCTSLDDLDVEYSINLDDDGTEDDITGSGTSATGSYPVGTHRITWTVTDLCGNESTCNITFTVAGAAPPEYAIVSGTIQNEEGNEVEYVMVEVSGDMNEEEETTETGVYDFELPMHNNYAVTPERNDNPLNGVTTYDLVKISQHILEVDLLNTPYKIIAADVNNSGTVTAVDLVELRKLILFIDSEFSNNSSWRFVDANFVFPNPQDPFETSFPEVYTINDLETDEQANFVAIKVGDVNTSSSPNGLTGSADDRNNGKELSFTAMDQKLIAGERYTVDFNISEASQLQGYQFTLSFDPAALAFENLIPGELDGINEANFGLHMLNEGVITTSYHNMSMIDAKNTTSFSITFEALTDVQLSEVLAINSRYTKAQAYINNESTAINLTFESEYGIATEHFQLFQNRPNPFKGETVISFNLPQSNAGTLTVYDLSGRVLKQVQAEFNTGYNEVNISSADLIGHGVYYYRLEVEDHHATRKMVLLK